MLLGALPASAWAANAEPETFSSSIYNPLIGTEMPADTAEDFEEAAAPAAEDGLHADLKAAAYVSEATAIRQIRDAMLRRESPITVYVTRSTMSGAANNWANNLVYSACDYAYAAGITDGDYLRWSWGHVKMSGSASGNSYALTYSVRYYTTYEQEQAVIAAMYQTVDSLGLSGITDYAKVLRIYQYIISHVTYDYDGLADMNEQIAIYGSSYQSLVPQHYFRPFTAYAALTSGTAVCQGYAALFYAMCRIAGVPVRIVTSDDHAWNIVCLNGTWYNVDATWDSNNPSTLEYFLKSNSTFNEPSHVREYPFNTASFAQSYPMSSTDYVSHTRYWDVDESNYHIHNIERVSELGLMNGVDTDRPMFGPGDNMQRAMLVTVLYRIEGEPAVDGGSGFTDVPAGQWYTNAVSWAAKSGIVNGYGDGSFLPQSNLTRQELIKILYEYTRYKKLDTGKTNDLSGYTDRSQVTWALAAVSWSVGSGIVMGTSATELSPTANGTREQLATILSRYLDHYPSVLAA